MSADDHTGLHRVSTENLLRLHANQTKNRETAVRMQTGEIKRKASDKSDAHAVWDTANVMRKVIERELRSRGVEAPRDRLDDV